MRKELEETGMPLTEPLCEEPQPADKQNKRDEKEIEAEFKMPKSAAFKLEYGEDGSATTSFVTRCMDRSVALNTRPGHHR